MTQNTFQFGNTYWQQIKGVATGTPTACSVANIYIAEIEKDVISKYDEIAFYRRLIDDCTGIWISHEAHTSTQQAARWNAFKKKI